MKILLVHRYFWPDSPPYASILRTVGEHLSQSGHNVEVLTAQPSYGGSDLHQKAPTSESLNGVQISRAPLLKESKSKPVGRLLNLVLFAAQVFLKVARGDYDAVMAATTPPVFVAFAARSAAKLRGAKFVYHMQDIYPEVLAANSGSDLSKPLQILRKIDAMNTRAADKVVVLSSDMKQSLSQRGHAVDNVSVINNFVTDGTHAKALNTPPVRPVDDSFQVVFAGNLGNFQGLDAVVAAFHILSGKGVQAHLLLLGDGAAEQTLRQQAGALLGKTVFFEGRVSQSEAEQVVSASDLALVTLNPGVIATAFPSKTMTYLSSGTPVLAAVEESSELATILSENNVGSSCELRPESIAEAVIRASQAPPVAPDTVKEFAHRYASTEARLPQWSNLFGELSG